MLEMIEIISGFFAMVMVVSLSEAHRIKETAGEEVSIHSWRLQILTVWKVLGLSSILGFGLTLLDYASAAALWTRIPIFVCLLITFVAATILGPVRWGSTGIGSSLSGSGAQGSSLLKRLIKVGVALVVFAATLALGAYLDDDASSQPPVVVAKYHVEGTDTNGSGFLNVCEEPAPCAGENPVGRLAEGDPVLIDCQLKGKQTKSKSGAVSYIWDRVGSEGFVSDLFVSTPGAGSFSPDIPHCAPWDWE
jgi:hypothetical protein